MTLEKNIVAVVIPCYRVTDYILDVLRDMPDFVRFIYCVDDYCPDQSGDFIEKNNQDSRVRIIKNNKNLGVGGAVIVGYEQALRDGCQFIVKIDGDGQMDPNLIESFVRPLTQGECDYTKGNRFFRIEDIKAMPGLRIFGNAVLSFLTKLSSGYWNIFDPTNGFTAIHANVLQSLPLDKIARGYFFESDMLFRLNTIRAVVHDIPMQAVYGEEHSNLKIKRVIFPFLRGHFGNFIKRIFYNYFLRDFNIASAELVFSVVLLSFGAAFGIYQWTVSIIYDQAASAGTVMLSALPVILGMQFLLSFMQYDIQAVPKMPVHKKLP